MSDKTERKAHFLSDVIDSRNADSRNAAMTAYLDGEQHTLFIIADELVRRCRTTVRNLKKGIVAPRLDICCCGETFVQVLMGSPYFEYPGLDAPEDIDITKEMIEEIPILLSKNAYDHLMALPYDDLVDALENEYGCSTCTFVQPHKADETVQRQYYEAVTKCFSAATVLAKAVGSDSAKIWLDAVRLLMPATPERSPFRIRGLNLIRADVEKAYARAEEAQAMLWVDVQFAGLKTPTRPAKTPRKTAMEK